MEAHFGYRSSIGSHSRIILVRQGRRQIRKSFAVAVRRQENGDTAPSEVQEHHLRDHKEPKVQEEKKRQRTRQEQRYSAEIEKESCKRGYTRTSWALAQAIGEKRQKKKEVSFQRRAQLLFQEVIIQGLVLIIWILQLTKAILSRIHENGRCGCEMSRHSLSKERKSDPVRTPSTTTESCVSLPPTQDEKAPKMEEDRSRVHVMSHMPWTSGPNQGLPYFDGKNVSEFLRAFEELCEDHGVKINTRVTRVVRYCSSQINTHLRMSAEYEEADWEKMKKMMIKEWEQTDDEQRMKTLAFLDELANSPRSEQGDIKAYCRQFKMTAKHLIEVQQITEYQSVLWFVRGLPEKLRKVVISSKKVDRHNPSSVKLNTIVTHVLEHWESQEEMTKMFVRPQREDMRDLVKEVQAMPPVLINPVPTYPVPSNPPPQNLWPVQVAPPPRPAPPVKQVHQNTLPNDYENELIKAIEAKLVLPMRAEICKVQEQLTMMQRQPQPQSQPQQDYLQGGYRGRAPIDRSSLNCYFCGGNHYRNDCNDLKILVGAGKVHLNENNKICLGQFRPGAHEVIFPRGMHGKDHIANLLSQQQPNPDMRVSSIRLGIANKREEDDDDSEEEYGDRRVGVAAARSNARSKAKESEKGHSMVGMPRIAKPPPRRSGPLPTTKNVRYGNYVEAVATAAEEEVEEEEERRHSQRSTTVTFEEPEVREITEPEDSAMGEAPDNVMEGVESVPRPRRRRGVAMDQEPFGIGFDKLVKILGQTNGPEKLAENLLNQEVKGITVQGLLAGSSDVRRIIFSKKEWNYDEDQEMVKTKAKPPAPAPVPVPAASMSSVRMDDKLQPAVYKRVLYQAACPVIPVTTRLGIQEALLDSGAEVNVMSLELAERLHLPIHGHGSVQAIGFDGTANSFLGVIKDLQINVQGVVVRVHMFVAKAVDPKYKIILGCPYQAGARAEINRDKDGNCQVLLHDQDTSAKIRIQGVTAAFEDGDSIERMIEMARNQSN